MRLLRQFLIMRYKKSLRMKNVYGQTLSLPPNEGGWQKRKLAHTTN